MYTSSTDMRVGCVRALDSEPVLTETPAACPELFMIVKQYVYQYCTFTFDDVKLQAMWLETDRQSASLRASRHLAHMWFK